MQFDDPFLDELRLMFMEGATISCLIRHIASQNEGGTSLHHRVQDSFFRAFGVGPLQISRKLDVSQLDGERLYFLNSFLVPEIIGRYPEWGGHLASRVEPFWKGLDPKPSLQFIQDSRPEDIRELAECWEQLDSQTQNYIRRTLGNLGEVFQNLEILARLSERLQRQVLEQTSHPASIKE